tara:strand:- start:84 stop:995 length:912 start_codon:yes stop_codon:yes gene_type:complete
MRFIQCLACLLALALVPVATAEALPIDGIAIGQSESDGRAALDAACQAVTRIEIAETRFPMARFSEVHLRCESLTLANGQAGGDALLTFADDALVMLEYRGAVDAFAPDREPAGAVGEFEAFVPDWIVVNRATGQAFVLASPELLTLAVAWDNPAWVTDTLTAPQGESAIPDGFAFGAALEDVSALADDQCGLVQLEMIDEIWLETGPAVQHQINCYGVDMGGYPRKFELVFGDGHLEQMWILFSQMDIPRLRADLTERFGPAIHVDETYEAFNGWRIAIRKDNPELRVGSEALAAIWQSRTP